METSARPDLVRVFEAFIGRAEFPCLGAKAAQARRNITFLTAGSLASSTSDSIIVHALQDFATTSPPTRLFVSFVALFPDTPALCEERFEAFLWERLQAIHELDAARYPWDPGVSSDPDSPAFSLSVGSRAFYVVGLFPGACRPARRFECAALVFNLHSQFERLREQGRYERLRSAIAERDLASSGSRNPMLADHGAVSEARQYSGRFVSRGWRCPFAPRTGVRG